MAIVGSLVFAALSFRFAERSQRISALFQLTQFQRELYGTVYKRPELKRVFRDDIDLSEEPLTDAERAFMVSAILHLFLAYEASRQGLIISLAGLEKDAASFLSKPIPNAAWNAIREYQNPQFRAWLDELLRNASLRAD